MKRFDLYKAIRHHRHLAEKRAMNFEQNKFAKSFIYITFSIMFIYLVGFAIMLSLIANESKSMTSVELMIGICPHVLVIDFLFRFMVQQTPSQIIKPYVLMPIPRYTCIDIFLSSSLFSSGNLIWFAMFVPYCLMSVVFSFGFFATLGLLLFLWLLILVNSQWYLIVRTLITDTMLWWLLPIGFYALIASPIYIGKDCGFERFFDLWSNIGTAITTGNVLPFLVVACLLVLLIAINRRLQYIHIWRELSRTEQTHLRSVSELKFLEQYGEIGEYLKLEIKSIMRNKNPRKSFISATAIVLVFSLLISFTDVYNGQYQDNFWCIYNFVIYGAMMLVRIMCNEGNYIDALMVHRENILSLFHAKYLFFCLMLFFPFILMLPTVFTGKWSILMLISYGIFTAGFQYFILFQMAVYNKQTIPLNTKFISKSGMENNYFQLIVEMVAFIVPLAIISVIQSILGNTTAYIIMLVIGLIFIITNRLWMRNIYNRMMKRRYINMEAFRASR